VAQIPTACGLAGHDKRVPPAGYNDFGSSYYNINIRGFAYDVAKGVTYQISASVRARFEGNKYGLGAEQFLLELHDWRSLEQPQRRPECFLCLSGRRVDWKNDLRAERERSGDVDAVVFGLAEDRKKVCHLQHVSKLLPKVKQFELASRLLGS
jgi:hypothetical protein